MKWIIFGFIAVANIFIAIRFRQPMAFAIAGAVAAVMIYCYLTEGKSSKSK